jgi:hypothetical protein
MHVSGRLRQLMAQVAGFALDVVGFIYYMLLLLRLARGRQHAREQHACLHEKHKDSEASTQAHASSAVYTLSRGLFVYNIY